MSKYSRDRLENNIMEILNETLTTTANDIVIKKSLFTYVKLTSDKSTVFVYVDTLNRKEIDEVVLKLNSSSKMFRSILSQRLNLIKVPQIKFIKDEVIDRVLKLDEIFSEIEKKEKK